MITIYALHVQSQHNRTIFDDVLVKLPQTSQERIRRYKRYDDVLRSCFAEAMVRTIIHRHLLLDYAEMKLGRLSHGKPVLLNDDRFCFNLSHSKDWIVCAVDHQSIGIDIQWMKSIDLNIAKRFFSSLEYEALMDCAEADRLSYFYQLWTCKESYIKALGLGLAFPLSSFTVCLANHEPRLITDDLDENFKLRCYDWADEYKMAICAGRNSVFSDQIVDMDGSTLMV